MVSLRRGAGTDSGDRKTNQIDLSRLTFNSMLNFIITTYYN